MDESEKDTGQQKRDNEKEPVNPRRDFFKRIGLIGGGIAAGGAALYSGYSYEQSKPNHGYVKVLTADNRLVEVPKDSISEVKPDVTMFQKRGREGLKGHRWVWVIDLSKCRNARRCIAACQSAHHLRPYEYHINVLVMQQSVNTTPYYMPKPCQHCDNPPCVSVCPVNATFKRQDGPGID